MSALEHKANSGQIPGLPLQISGQMLSVFAALARKHQVPGAQFAIYHDGSTISTQCPGCVRIPHCRQFTLCNEFRMGDRPKCHLFCRVSLPMS
jgi:hypothetical protein